MSKRARRPRKRGPIRQPAAPVAAPETGGLPEDYDQLVELGIQLLKEYAAQVREDSFDTPSTPVKKQRCEAFTLAGEPCRAWARAAKTVCIYHDPEYRARLVESGARGGANSRAGLLEQALAPQLDLTGRESLLEAASGLAGLLLAGELSPSRAAPLVRLLSVAQRAVDRR